MRRLPVTLALLACHGAKDDPSETSPRSTGETSAPVPTVPTDSSPTGTTTGDPPLLRFVSFGDYGSATDQEQAVADLVGRLAPDFIATLGDNVYELDGGEDTRIGQYYSDWIYPYGGAYGAGSQDGVNRFWACLGNHDWDAGIDEWYSFFELPNNERYWTEQFGTDPATGGPLLQLLCMDSDSREPDGNTATSVQGQWVQSALASSTARWNVVVYHHPGWSSGLHGDNRHSQWPWAVWGADLVLNGHDHIYERLVRDGAPFVTDGRGGAGLYPLIGHVPNSEVALNTEVGATAIDVREDTLTIQAFDTLDRFVDQLTVRHDRPLGVDTRLVRLGSQWRFDDTGTDQGTSWRDPAFDDSSWAQGFGQLGFGDGDEAGPVSSVYHPTVYFRLSFDVPDPSLFPRLAADMICDDGAAVYLNGTEVVRANLPAGDLAFGTLASTDVNVGTAEDAIVTWPFDNTALVAGENVLAVEVHQASPTTGDLSFDLALRAVNGDRLVHANEVDWEYKDDGVAPASTWRTVDDSSGWKVGPAPLGWGHDDLATVVDEGNPTQENPTTWFRRSFTVDDPAAFSALWLRVIRDDGVVVWLNGAEVERSNLPAGEIGPGTYAVSEVPAGWESAWTQTFIDPTLLVAGTNTIAAEVHEGLPAGRNLRFDLELAGLK